MTRTRTLSEKEIKGVVCLCLSLKFGRGLQVGERELFNNEIIENIEIGNITLRTDGSNEGTWLFYDVEGM